MPDILKTSREGRVLRVALNRPDKRNALNAELCRVLVETLEDAFTHPEVGAILLCGNGRHFCAGMDLSEVSAATANSISDAQERLFTIGSKAEKPIVAAIEGAALGGGMGLVGNCHIVVAHPEASFGLTEIRVGLWPFLVYRALSAGLGERRVLELALSGRVFGAAEGKEMSLVQEVDASPQTRASEIAGTVSEFSPTTIRSGLRFTREVRGQDWEAAGRIARRMRDEVFASSDFEEGRRAFVEKRTPRWPSIHGQY
jgi:enoyl-CoA hydratase/carnithine racemase